MCHGGLFRDEGVTLADIDAADRAVEPPDTGVVCDILWSDPQDAPGRAASKRGTGCMFGPDVTQRFLADNGLELLVRSHEMKEVHPSSSSHEMKEVHPSPSSHEIKEVHPSPSSHEIKEASLPAPSPTAPARHRATRRVPRRRARAR